MNKLPSLDAAAALWRGEKGAAAAVVVTWLARSALTVAGIYLLRKALTFAKVNLESEEGKALAYGLAASLMIEGAVLLAAYPREEDS